jgi:adenine-specific DNA-methyltransferase
MATVVISGSRSIGVLPQEAIASLDKIIALGFDILIGDAPGVDFAVQCYLKSRNYNKVNICISGRNNIRPRNNAGFPCIIVPGSYSDRDCYMCSRAQYGLAVWDGKSKGTAHNISRVPKTKIIRA